MKANFCLCLVCACLSGCLTARPSATSTFLHLAGRNFCEASSICIEDQVFKHTAEKYASAAWRQVCKTASGGTFSSHYRSGFIEGYIDYLDAGGNGEPPAMGPFRYQMHQYQTYEGRRALHEWFAGFRHGSSVAKASGFREMILVPVAHFPCEPPPVQFFLPPGGQLRENRQSPGLYSTPPSPQQSPGRSTLPKPILAPPVPIVPESKPDDKPKVRLLLPEPLPIAFQQGGIR